MNAVAGATLGAVLGLGLVLAIGGFTGRLHVPAIDVRALVRSGDTQLLSAGGAVVCGVLTYAATGWVTAAVFAAIGGALTPGWLARRRVQADSIAKTEAVAGWAEMLRDTMAAASGIHEAIAATAPVAPTPIRADVIRLAQRLQRDPLSVALDDFADQLSDPVGDLVVAALLVAGERQAGNLAGVLTAAATSARASATMRLRIETGRTRIRTSVRVTVVVFALVAVGLVLLNRSYLDPFDTATGQVVLAVIGGLFGLSTWSLARLAQGRQPERLFGTIQDYG
jgi:Flp pilus assembly protein TadB